MVDLLVCTPEFRYLINMRYKNAIKEMGVLDWCCFLGY